MPDTRPRLNWFQETPKSRVLFPLHLSYQDANLHADPNSTNDALASSFL